MMAKEFVKKLTMTATVNSYLSATTAGTGAHMIILGQNHLDKIGLNISFLHRTTAVLDCANASAIWAMGIFYGCIRGRSALTGNTLVHRGNGHGVRDWGGHLPPVAHSAQGSGGHIHNIPEDRRIWRHWATRGWTRQILGWWTKQHMVHRSRTGTGHYKCQRTRWRVFVESWILKCSTQAT